MPYLAFLFAMATMVHSLALVRDDHLVPAFVFAILSVGLAFAAGLSL